MRILITGASGFIGTNLIDALLLAGHEVGNLDRTAPQKVSQSPYFIDCDIMDLAGLTSKVKEFKADAFIHLAARTDTDSEVLEEYDVNITGVRNVLAAIQASESIKRLVMTSTQYVIGPGRPFEDILAYAPHTVYGESKVLTEKITREANLPICWTIIRPTNIWGPWHPRYPCEFWKVLRQGRYLHPGNSKVIKCYGFVGTVVEQIMLILGSPESKVNGQTFYVGDPPGDLRDWVHAFSLAITGKRARVVPTAVVKTLAKVGDVVKGAGLRFPIFTSRYKSMTEDYLTPIEQTTFSVFGRPSHSLEDGVRITKEWLDTHTEQIKKKCSEM